MKGGDRMVYGKLLGRIVEVYGTRKAFANDAGYSVQTLREKLRGRSQWDQKEILKACELLKIPHEDIPVYFFNF